MMPRFPGLSRPTQYASVPFVNLLDEPLSLGFGQDVGTRIPYEEPGTPVPQIYPNPRGPTPDASVGNVRGASTPDLLIARGQAATGGGLTVGTLAFVALLGVGGWFVWKKTRGE